MAHPTLSLGEPADEADWRALVERGLKGAPWGKLTGKTADGIELKPLYREPDAATAHDEMGLPGGAPFVRAARQGPWRIRQAYAHPDHEQTNREILADLESGVTAIELKIDPAGYHGIAITRAADLDAALADVILEAAPVSLDAGDHGAWIAGLLRDKLKGVAAPGTAFNLDPIGAALRSATRNASFHIGTASEFAATVAAELPSARSLRVDARIVHEAGGTEAQELAYALSCGIGYLRELERQGLDIARSAAVIGFAFSVGPDVLIEVAKLRALRLCWARVLEASGAKPEHRAAHIHAFTSKRMMTRYDAEANILRVTCAALAAAIAGADDITTLPFTDALGLPTLFARRVARNTQLVLMEESHLDHVADPAGGAWFVEKLTRELAELAWAKMQAIEAQGGIIAALAQESLQRAVAEARTARQAAFARRKETITGVTDFPLLTSPAHGGGSERRNCETEGGVNGGGKLAPIRWAEPFEALRERAEGKTASVFVATLGSLAEFSPRAQFAANLLAVGGIAAHGADAEHATLDALSGAYMASGATVAVIVGADARYGAEAEDAARALKAAGARWVVLAGKPGEREASLRKAGLDQFVYVGVDVLRELETLHAALGVK